MQLSIIMFNQSAKMAGGDLPRAREKTASPVKLLPLPAETSSRIESSSDAGEI